MLNLLYIPFFLLLTHPQALRLRLQPELLGRNSGRQKTLSVILTYVKITSSGVNCALKNSRGGKSQSGKGIKKGIGLRSFIR